MELIIAETELCGPCAIAVDSAATFCVTMGREDKSGQDWAVSHVHRCMARAQRGT